MRSRCHHLLTDEALAPMSTAMTSLDGQRSITDRKVFKSGMDSSIRQIVLNLKSNLSHDCGRHIGLIYGVTKNASASQYLDEFMLRVRAARVAARLKQHEIAGLLGLDQPTYSKYEVRSFIPHPLIPKFCQICHIDTEWLFTGKGRGPVMNLDIRKTEETPNVSQSASPKRRKRKSAAA
jgi:hypothetical protein